MDKLKRINLDSKTRKEIQDLSAVLQEVATGKEEWCYTYRDKEEIGRVIYQNLLEYNKKLTKKKDDNLVFAFSEELVKKGILSQLQGFQALAILIEDFNVDYNKDKEMLLKILDSILELVDGEKKNHFDATPYLPDSHVFDEDHYTDTLTWFLSCACSVFRLIIQKNFDVGQERKERFVELFKYGLKYIIDSFLDTEEEGTFRCGWNYTGGTLREEKTDPSLYYTFVVSEVLIDIFTTFENVIKYAETEFVKAKIDEAFLGREEEFSEEIAAKKGQIEETNRESIEKYTANGSEIKREKELFELVNGTGPVLDKETSLYAKFEDLCQQTARCVWNLTKDRLRNKFFSANLANVVSEDAIVQSTSSDALFNSVFIINMVINAGLDEEAEDRINYYTLNNSEEYNKALAEYDEMRDTLRLGYESVYQMYKSINSKGKAYKVNEFIPAFEENFSTAEREEKINELRRARIRAFSLMPLLVKTKTSMSQFVIRYPQYDMQLYLEQILERRVVEKGETLWVWEKEGYSSSSNYYFISALSDFFQYYEEYESKYSKNARENNKRIEKAKADYLTELTETGKIRELQHSLDEKIREAEVMKEEIGRLVEQVREKQDQIDNDPLNKALNEFIYKAVQDRIAKILTDTIKDMATSIAADGVRRAKGAASDAQSETGENEAAGLFEESIHELIMALISEQLFGAIYEDEVIKDKDKRFAPIKKDVGKDFKQVLRYYLQQIVESQNSDFVKTKGYRGLRQMLQTDKKPQGDEK
ncbi:MAG: hypothetical protein J1F39_01210 [Clostridiales bacterium]|nr:hypothetical protein [Clostridiales bacterium]